MKLEETLFLLGFCFSVKLEENWAMGKNKKLFEGYGEAGILQANSLQAREKRSKC